MSLEERKQKADEVLKFLAENDNISVEQFTFMFNNMMKFLKWLEEENEYNRAIKKARKK